MFVVNCPVNFADWATVKVPPVGNQPGLRVTVNVPAALAVPEMMRSHVAAGIRVDVHTGAAASRVGAGDVEDARSAGRPRMDITLIRDVTLENTGPDQRAPIGEGLRASGNGNRAAVLDLHYSGLSDGSCWEVDRPAGRNLKPACVRERVDGAEVAGAGTARFQDQSRVPDVAAHITADVAVRLQFDRAGLFIVDIAAAVQPNIIRVGPSDGSLVIDLRGRRKKYGSTLNGRTGTIGVYKNSLILKVAPAQRDARVAGESYLFDGSVTVDGAAIDGRLRSGGYVRF